jgi:hypothetical protein
MAEDLISSYIDRDGIKGDTAFILDEINKALKAIKDFNSIKPSLDAAKGYEAAAAAIGKQKEAQDKLNTSSEKLNEAQSRTARALKETVASIAGAATGNKQLAESYDELIKLSVQNQLASKGLAAARKEAEKAFKDGIISAQEYTSILEDVKKKEVEITITNLDLNRAIRNTEKGFQSAEGSLNGLRAELNISLQAFDRLSEIDKKGDVGLELKKNIDELTTKIKEQEEETQRFQRNVGNYQGSAKILVDALSNVEKKLESLREKQTKLQNLSSQDPIGFKVGNQASELNQVTAEIVELQKEAKVLTNVTSDPKFLNVAAKTGDARAEIRGFTTTLVELERQGLGSTDFAKQIRKNLAEITDQVADTKDEIKALSSDTRSFDQLTSSVSLLTNTYQTFVGVQALYGDQSEETQETIKKLVAVQSISNGLQEIGEQLTKRGTLANKAYTAVQTLYATATNSSAAATVRLAAATKLLLGGLAIGAIILLVTKLQEWSKAAKSVVDRQKVLNDVTRAAASAYGQEKSKLDSLVATIKTEGISRREKFESLKKLQEAFPGYFDNIKTEGELNTKLEEAYAKAAKGILLKAQAQAAGDLLAENSTKRLTAEIDRQEKITNAQKALATQKASYTTGDARKRNLMLDQNFMNDVKRINEEYKKEAEGIDETNKFLVKSIQDSNKAIEDIGGFVTDPDDDNKGEDQLKKREKELKARFELEKLEQQKLIDLQKSFANAEGIPVNVRINARLKQFEEERKLAEMIRDFEIQQEGLTAAERLLIVERSNNEVLKLENEAAIGIIAIRKEASDQLKQDVSEVEAVTQAEITKRTEDEVKSINDSYQARLNAIELNAENELRVILTQYEQGELSKEQYEEQKLTIENKARKESLLAEIAFQQRLISISNLSPEEKAKALNKLANLEEQVRKEEIKAAELNAEKRLSIEEALSDRLKELRDELKETAFSLLTSGIDNEKNKIQDEIDALEAKKQKEIEVANQTIQSETDKAAAISTIEARANAQREALERKKRELDERKARFERIKNIAEIISNTARGVAAALPNVVLAAIVGAIGAAQLARAIATPIPRFYGGKSASNKYEGMAVVGDGGRSEAILREDGTVERTPNTPTLTYVKRNDIIFPDARQLEEARFQMAISNTGKLVSMRPKKEVQSNHDVVQGLKSLERTVKNKKEITIKGISKRDMILKYGANAWRYLE